MVSHSQGVTNQGQRSATVHVDANIVQDAATEKIRTSVLDHMDRVAQYTGTDVFLLNPKNADSDDELNSGVEPNNLDQRYRVAIYGDVESVEHAKTRILIMIDQIVSLQRQS